MPSRGQKLEIEEGDGFLRVLYGENPITLETIVRTINLVADRLRSTGFKKVLLLRDAPLLDSDANRAMTAQLIHRAVGRDVRFAIVDVFGNDPEETKLAVEASRKAGWDLTGFATIEEAEAWLRSI